MLISVRLSCNNSILFIVRTKSLPAPTVCSTILSFYIYPFLSHLLSNWIGISQRICNWGIFRTDLSFLRLFEILKVGITPTVTNHWSLGKPVIRLFYRLIDDQSLDVTAFLLWALRLYHFLTLFNLILRLPWNHLQCCLLGWILTFALARILSALIRILTACHWIGRPSLNFIVPNWPILIHTIIHHFNLLCTGCT